MKFDRRSTDGVPRALLTNLSPFRESLTPAHEKRQEGCAGACSSVGLRNGQRGKCLDASDEHECKCDAHADMI